jgi:hypothetical protein
VVINQFDVFRNTGEGTAPFLFVLQHPVNSGLNSVIVAPIDKLNASQIVSKLHVAISVHGQDFHIRLQRMAAIPKTQLRTFVENRGDLHQAVIAGIDVLFSGF